MSIKSLALSAFVAAAALAPMSAHAVVITGDDFTQGASSQTFDLGLQATAIGGTFDKKSNGLHTGVGISGGVGGEIDLGEAILFNSTSPNLLKLNSFNVGLLFTPGAYGDTVYEVALLTVDGGVVGTGFLRVTGATTAQWFGLGGSVTNVSPATYGNGGEWRVENIDVAFSSLRFTTADLLGEDDNPANSDYNLVSLDYTAVPEPASMTIIGAGLLGMGLLRRRKQA